MAQRRPCIRPGTLPCQSYAPGHNLHVIHGKHVGRTPWGWRDGVVVSTNGGDVVVEYLETGHQVRLWHHASLAAVRAGSPVRVHEQYYVLGGPFGWLNVVVMDGLGAVPEPAEPGLWSAQVVMPVVDLSTGRGLAVDHVSDEGPT